MAKHLPTSLANLTPTEQVIDTLYRCVNSLDVPDIALLESSLHKDAVWIFTGIEGMPTMNGLDEIRANCYDRVSRLDTLHHLSNFRVKIDPDGKSAALTCGSVARHMRPGTGTTLGSPHYTSGAIYNVDLTSDGPDGLWKITRFVLNLVWVEGDQSVMAG